jgi:N-acetylglucosaminyldiphosphoundecaprenol N-acetyl-beta-D-mannosaminyltransferase
VKDPVWVWGVPLAPLTLAETVTAVGGLVENGQPTYFVTANVHYAMLTDKGPDLRALNAHAAFILADGAPLVWASRWYGSPLPERVAGADLIFELSADAARNGYRLFFLGGVEGVAAEAARRLRVRYPQLQIVGTESPPFRQLTEEERSALIARIRAARPDILFVAFGQPKGERWIAQHFLKLGVPVSVQIGASLDFAAGRVHRAPRWMQKAGLEWAFRLMLEPRRLFVRYVQNAWFIVRMIVRDLSSRIRGCPSPHPAVPADMVSPRKATPS